ncbi:Cupin domain protein [Caballeronia peredens]|nr:Cupin domain protein [Caballeronia peredens]
MQSDLLYKKTSDESISIPAIGVDLEVHIAPVTTDTRATLIETTDAPGFGPPQHRHKRETEVFHITQGRYLFEVDGELIVAHAGDTVIAHAGSTHRFTSIDTDPSRMLVLIMPGLDATTFFSELRDLMAKGKPDPAALQALGDRWDIEFLGPPLTCPAELEEIAR